MNDDNNLGFVNMEERRDPRVCAEHMKMMHQHATQIALLEQSVVSINKSVESINGNVSKLIWIVVGALVMSVMAWLLRGGLHV